MALVAGLLLIQTGPIRGGTRQFNPSREIKPFDLPALDGGRQTLDDFRGRPLLLSIWATWCAPCREELPQFQSAREKLAEAHPEAVFMTVNVGDGGARARSFLTQLDLDLPVLLAGKNFIYDYDILTIPSLMVLDRDGKLAILHEGWGKDIDLPEVLREDLEMLDRLSRKPSTR